MTPTNSSLTVIAKFVGGVSFTTLVSHLSASSRVYGCGNMSAILLQTARLFACLARAGASVSSNGRRTHWESSSRTAAEYLSLLSYQINSNKAGQRPRPELVRQ